MDAATVSASRVNKYLGCGIEFKRYYIDGEPEVNLSSHALFGLVIHNALENWALDRSQDLVKLVVAAWSEETEDTVVADFLEEYTRINLDVMRAEAAARAAWERRNPGKESKAPRMTKDFKESDAAKSLGQLLARWIPKLNEGSPWTFSERDPLPALYDESLRLCRDYAAKWRHLPNALHTELSFTVEWNGFHLKGFIDAIEPIIDLEGAIVGVGVVDYKTYRAEPTPLKDWRQGCMYDVAIRDLIERDVLGLDVDVSGLPIYVIFDYPRLGVRHDYSITETDHAQLLSELSMYRAGVENGIFLPPEKNTKPDFCSYGETCCMLTRNGVGQRAGLYDLADAA